MARRIVDWGLERTATAMAAQQLLDQVAGLREYSAQLELAVQTLDGRDFGGQRINFSAVPTGQTRDWRHAEDDGRGRRTNRISVLKATGNRKGLRAPCANTSAKRRTASTHYPCCRFLVVPAHFLFVFYLFTFLCCSCRSCV